MSKGWKQLGRERRRRERLSRVAEVLLGFAPVAAIVLIGLVAFFMVGGC